MFSLVLLVYYVLCRFKVSFFCVHLLSLFHSSVFFIFYVKVSSFFFDFWRNFNCWLFSNRYRGLFYYFIFYSFYLFLFFNFHFCIHLAYDPWLTENYSFNDPVFISVVDDSPSPVVVDYVYDFELDRSFPKSCYTMFPTFKVGMSYIDKIYPVVKLNAWDMPENEVFYNWYFKQEGGSYSLVFNQKECGFSGNMVLGDKVVSFNTYFVEHNFNKVWFNMFMNDWLKLTNMYFIGDYVRAHGDLGDDLFAEFYPSSKNFMFDMMSRVNYGQAIGYLSDYYGADIPHTSLSKLTYLNENLPVFLDILKNKTVSGVIHITHTSEYTADSEDTVDSISGYVGGSGFEFCPRSTFMLDSGSPVGGRKAIGF